MALANGGYLQTFRNYCKFFSESDKKKLAMVISKVQVSDPGPSWTACLLLSQCFLPIQGLKLVLANLQNESENKNSQVQSMNLSHFFASSKKNCRKQSILANLTHN